MSTGYHDTRLEEDSKRSVVWKSLWRFYFRNRIARDWTVLDLGAGYGDFINSVEAKRRIAVDTWPDMRTHLQDGVESVISTSTDLSAIADDSVDYVFSSNLFEHLSRDELLGTLNELRRISTGNGQLVLLQPNYRYAYKEYFDDYTHVSIFSHISIADFLAANGWNVREVHPRFLPLTVKSRLPTFPFLIWLYLKLPFKPMGKQMLIVAGRGTAD